MESSVISAVNLSVYPFITPSSERKRDLEVSDLFFSDEQLPILEKNDKCGFNALESISVLFA